MLQLNIVPCYTLYLRTVLEAQARTQLQTSIHVCVYTKLVFTPLRSFTRARIRPAELSRSNILSAHAIPPMKRPKRHLFRRGFHSAGRLRGSVNARSHAYCRTLSFMPAVKARVEMRSPDIESPGSKSGRSKAGRSPVLKSPEFLRRAPLSPGSPPSSLARSASPHLSPSERAKVDEERLKARRAAYRARIQPGPGAHDPQLTRKGREFHMSVRNGAETMQSSAFMSKTVRTGYPLLDSGDPGSYEPVFLTIANFVQRTATFNSSMQSGGGAFGTKTARQLTIPPDIGEEALPTRGATVTNGPGPAAYTPQLTENGKEFDMHIRNGAETMQSSAFASKLPRIAESMPAAQKDNPGPGKYDPNDQAMRESLPGSSGNAMSKVGRDTRFPADTVGQQEHITPPAVGPGSYEPNNWGNSIASDQNKRMELTSRIQLSAKPSDGALGFGASHTQHELPFEMDDAAKVVPGPDAYEPKMTKRGLEHDMSVRSGAELMKSSAFASTLNLEKARSLNLKGMGDPGKLDLSGYKGVLHSARQTFHKLMTIGKGSFGATTARQLTIPPDIGEEALPTRGATVTNGPGPAAYTPQLTENGKEFDMHIRNGAETMQSSAFASKLPRIAESMPAAQKDNPGPGKYDPNDQAMRESLPGSSGNAMSKVGRDTRFPADTVGQQEHITPPAVGPGSYEPKVTNNGALTIAEHAFDRAKSADASFASTKERNVLEWLVDEVSQWFLPR